MHDQCYAHQYRIYCSCSCRKRKPADEDVADDEDEEQSLFALSAGEEGATSFSSQEPEKLVRKWPTNIGKSYEWGKKIIPGQTHRERDSSFDRSEFQSVDGDKVFHYNHWVQRHELTYGARSTFERAQRALVAKQQDQHSVQLACKFSIESKLTQVPYRKSLQCFSCVLDIQLFIDIHIMHHCLCFVLKMRI